MIKLKPYPCNKIKAVIFDFDGTLADTEPNWYIADKKLLLEYEIIFTKKMKQKFIGGSSLDMMTEIKNKYKINDSIKVLLDKKNQYYLEYAQNNTLIYPKMKKLVKMLKGKNYLLAVASGSSPIILYKILNNCNMLKYFDAIVSVEEVAKGKPEPDVFLEVANRLKISPENCLVFEDSSYGIEAAKIIQMHCIAIPYILSSSLPESYYKADILFDKGMKEFNIDKIIKWIEHEKK